MKILRYILLIVLLEIFLGFSFSQSSFGEDGKEIVYELLKKWGFSSFDELIRSGEVYCVYYLSPFIKDGLSQKEKDSAVLLSGSCGFPYLFDEFGKLGGNIFALDEIGNNALHLASTASSVYLVEHLIRLGLNPNSRNKENFAPLHLCAKRGFPEVARALLYNGASPHMSARDDINYPPANIAGENKNFGVVRILKAYDAHYTFESAVAYGDIELVDAYLKEHPEWLLVPPARFSPPAVIVAVSANQKEMLLHLLKKGAVLDCGTVEGDRPITIAIRNRNKEMIRLLVDLGVDINYIGSAQKDETALEYAIRNTDLEIVNLLVELGADVNNVNVVRDSKTPLHLAVEMGKRDIVEYLIDRGANINARDINGMSPIHYAVKISDIKIVESLLNKGADIEILDRNRFTPLLFSISVGEDEVSKYIIERGANLEAKDKNGNGVLHLCAEKGKLELVKFVFEKSGGKIDINNVNRKKETPLHIAVRNNREDIVKYFVDNGADINAKDSSGASPLSIALEVDNLALAKYIVEKGGDVNVELNDGRKLPHLAGSSKSPEAMKWLISLGLDINVKDKYENLPIHYTCISGELNTLMFLIQKGQAINEKNKKGYTPLHVACERGQLILAKALIDAGADLSLLTSDGKSALHLCAEKGYWGPAQILILKGVNVDIRDESGYTPLHLSAMNGEDRFVQLISARGADICAKTNSGKTPLDLVIDSISKFELPEGPTYAQIRKYEGLRRTYRLITTLICEEYLLSIKMKRVDRLKTLCEVYPTFGGVFYLGKAPIHRAIWSHSLEMTNLLIKAGVDVNVSEISREGYTPLHIAVENRLINIVDLLLKSGARKDAKDNKGQTPIELAEKLGFEEIYTFLKEN
ncbi:MAG: ankyrin repeat domain-containing protein [Candidatus Hydrogenedentes bacterium]|nr:ankyrin repeat domain-containing protein [Candidatus Hydrogenedentota bacterium]